MIGGLGHSQRDRHKVTALPLPENNYSQLHLPHALAKSCPRTVQTPSWQHVQAQPSACPHPAGPAWTGVCLTMLTPRRRWGSRPPAPSQLRPAAWSLPGTLKAPQMLRRILKSIARHVTDLTWWHWPHLLTWPGGAICPSWPGLEAVVVPPALASPGAWAQQSSP